MNNETNELETSTEVANPLEPFVMRESGNLYSDDPDYQDWINTISKDCDCCPTCHQDIPCGGVQAGGMCDNLCSCDAWDELDVDEDY